MCVWVLAMIAAALPATAWAEDPKPANGMATAPVSPPASTPTAAPEPGPVVTTSSGTPGTAFPAAVPGARAARNVAVIPITGVIDKYTPNSVRRRMESAARAGANALVFEINSPGGDLTATLATCSLIKASSIPNTVAWIHPDAYSGGAIIALACREIVVSDAATMGDALPIMVDPIRGLQALPDAEREKMIGPLIAEVVDSARRSGHDELLVQGFVRRGVELWWVEHAQTGRRLFVNERQYEAAVGESPDRTGSPAVPSATSQFSGPATPLKPISPERRGVRDGQVDPAGEGADPRPEVIGEPEPGAAPAEFVPGAPGMSPDLVDQVNDQLRLLGSSQGNAAVASQRPDVTKPGEAGQYRVLEYVADGHGLLILKSPQMLKYGVAQRAVNSENDLKEFFGATTVSRLETPWSESLVRVLTHPILRGLLIIVFFVALFVEMSHPGAAIPGIVAVVALITLIVPPLLIDMASWWEVLAIVAGLLLLAVELFILPGFGVAGVLGLVLLFGGLIGTFVTQGSSIFPNTAQQTRELTWGVSTVVVALLTSGIALVFLWRSLPNLPVFKQLIHQDATGKHIEGLLEAMAPTNGPVSVGAEGVALSPLRPSGRAQFGDQVIDAYSDTGMVMAGARVKVIRVEGLRVVVDRA